MIDVLEPKTRNFTLHHGTIKKYSEIIISRSKFIFETRDNHWLGNGIYFFVDDLEQAFKWSELTRRKESKKNPYIAMQDLKRQVLELDFQVEKSKYLNLDSRSDRMKIDSFLEELSKQEVCFKVSNKHKAMCTVMDFYVRYYDIKATKYTFTNAHSSVDLSRLGIEDHGEQFCIYKSEYIDFSNITVESEG